MIFHGEETAAKSWMSSLTLKAAMEDFEKRFLQKAKERWKTTEKIGEMLDVNQSTISRKLRKYGID